MINCHCETKQKAEFVIILIKTRGSCESAALLSEISASVAATETSTVQLGSVSVYPLWLSGAFF